MKRCGAFPFWEMQNKEELLTSRSWVRRCYEARSDCTCRTICVVPVRGGLDAVVKTWNEICAVVVHSRVDVSEHREDDRVVQRDEVAIITTDNFVVLTTMRSRT